MPYKISGTLSDASRIIIIKESDWSIESNTNESVGAYEIDSLASGAKFVVGRKSDGESLGYGNVTPVEYVPATGDRGVFGGSYDDTTNIIDYITISSTGDATDFGDLTAAKGLLAATSNGTNDRGVFGGGNAGGVTNSIEYITISSTGDAVDFGDLTVARNYLAGTSNATNNRGVFGGGLPGPVNTIDYITISSTGDAIDFGNLTSGRYYPGGCSNGTNDRGIFAGGGGQTNVIDYITISSTGNAINFGDLTEAKSHHAACSNGTNNRGVFGGGYNGTPPFLNVIEYITISTPGNATDFGDLTLGRFALAATSNGTNDRGVFGGGSDGNKFDTIDYVTISSVGDATDFGDLTLARSHFDATSNA